MKIIELGNIDIQFACPDCSTIFEVYTRELERLDARTWAIACPLCGKVIKVGNGEVVDFLIKREKLEGK